MTHRIQLGTSDLKVFPLSLGGNVFGWTADEAVSHALLDSYVEGGGNFIDTADVYSIWAEGNEGGDSEMVLGSWLHQRGNRQDVVIGTKVSAHPRRKGLQPANVRAALDESLERLQTDYIDLYYAHIDDTTMPIAEIAGLFSELVDEGKIRYPAISNMSAERMHGWMTAANEDGLHPPVALQPLYNVMERGYETTYRDVASKHGLAVLPYNGLARGFLTGKYREGVRIESERATAGYAYLSEERGKRVLAVLDAIAAGHATEVGSVALAWLRSKPTVLAPISSARTPAQLPMLMNSVAIQLSTAEIRALDVASQTKSS